MRKRSREKKTFAADLLDAFQRCCNETIACMDLFWGALNGMGGSFGNLEVALGEALRDLVEKLAPHPRALGYEHMLESLVVLSSEDSGIPVMFSNAYREKVEEMKRMKKVYNEKVNGYGSELKRYMADIAEGMDELESHFGKKRKKKETDVLAELKKFSDAYVPKAKNLELLINVLIADSVKLVQAIRSVSEVILSLLMNRTGQFVPDEQVAVQLESISDLERWKELYTDPKYVLIKYFVAKLLKFLDDTKSPKRSVTATVVRAMEIDGIAISENERVEVLAGDDTKLDVSIGFDKCSISPEDLRIYLPES